MPGVLLIAAVFVVFVNCCECVTPGQVQVNHWFDDQIYNISVNGAIWFKNAPLVFRKDWKEYSSARGELKGLLDTPHQGTDRLGDFETATWYLGVDDNVVALGYKVYDKKNYVILQQHFLNKTSGTSTGNKDLLISTFPAVMIDDTMAGELGYIAYSGTQYGSTGMEIGTWAPGKVNMNTGTAGGPTIFFDKKDNVVIIAPFSEFMSASTYLDTTQQPNRLSWGIMGGVMEIPEDFMAQFMVFYSPNGINKAFEEWGSLMKDFYGKDPSYRKADMTINYLGYYTDNGAYYYWRPEPHKTNEQTIYDIQSYALNSSIPYKYIQYDEWWYIRARGPTGLPTGTIKWSLRPKVFPSGMRKLYENTEWPVVAHNMYWSNQTTYAKQNGGNYTFLLDESGMALPFEEGFWNDLFKESKLWGLAVYEQDYMNVNTDAINATVSDVVSGKTWLMDMGNAARKNGLTIQYCMSYPRHAMTALEIPAVTQARVYMDNRPNTDHWTIGVSSLFAEAMGIAPFKDNFWSTEVQTGNGYNQTEPHTSIHAAISTLSTGPVGLGDKVGHSNPNLIMRSCNAEGLILKPSKPITAIDKQIQQMAFGGNIGPEGKIYTTYSNIDNHIFGIILAANISMDYTLRIQDTGINMTQAAMVMISDLYISDTLVTFNESQPLKITTSCTTKYFCLYYYSPVFTVGNDKVMIYGEVDKWTPMSNNRVTGIRVISDDLFLQLVGVPNEIVSFRFFRNMIPVAEIVKCSLGPTGSAEMSFNKKICTS
ncbi:hypothetical protein SNE40_022776 [Patella caerulea]|uniref:Uncharacterized protein n=1 Tax=Patella caerulea TaxID=87958 RepID=A0AAN8IW73_PATCE